MAKVGESDRRHSPLMFFLLRLVSSQFIFRHYCISPQLQHSFHLQRDARNSSMPIHTRSGKILYTGGPGEPFWSQEMDQALEKGWLSHASILGFS